MPKRKGGNNDINDPTHLVNEEQEDKVHKRSKDSDGSHTVEHGDAAVDYDESADSNGSGSHANTDATPEPESLRDKEDSIQRDRISGALRGWCSCNITSDGEDDSDVSERSEALAEVGMLLVFEYEKYLDGNAMRSELSDIESIIGGEHVVTKFVNFLLSLQNQVKKAHAVAAARDARKKAQIDATHRAVNPVSSIPMHLRPAAQPVLFSRPVVHGQPWPLQSQQHPSLPQYPTNLVASTPRRRESEFEMKKNQILAECTEHLKALIEKASKATDPKEKATILELIKKVKSRMESMKSAPPPANGTQIGVARAPQ